MGQRSFAARWVCARLVRLRFSPNRASERRRVSRSRRSSLNTNNEVGAEKEKFMFGQTKGLKGLCIVWVLVFLAGGNLVLAQTGTTSLRGTILDKSGAAV